MKNISSGLLLCTLLLAGVFISGCNEEKTDEEMILDQIEILQTAIEEHDRGDFMAVIDEQYADQMNNNRSALQRLLMIYFYRFKDISVYVSGTQVEVQSIRADAHSQVVVTGGKSLIPERARHAQVHSCWKKVSGEWLLSCLEW